MRKIFLIVFESNHPTVGEIDRFHKNLTTDPDVYSWWHHITNTYIIVTSNNATCTSIREFTQQRMPNTHYLVLQINYLDYEGFLPQEAWDWLQVSRIQN